MQFFDREELARWSEWAAYTLASARRDLEAGDYSWASFKAQQSAEYALKGLLRGWGLPATGHSVLRLAEQLEQAGATLPAGLANRARTLDRHYIPPRYPDAYASGTPAEFYDRRTADDAVSAAQEVIQYAREAAGLAEAD
ncbi:MAG: HEPN domain-containing protein [bacterium]|nr:HEPN domain-containing protein [bacterium]